MQYNMGRSGLSDVVFLPHFHLVHIRVLSLSSCPIHPSIPPTQYIVPVMIHYTILFLSLLLGLFENSDK